MDAAKWSFLVSHSKNGADLANKDLRFCIAI